MGQRLLICGTSLLRPFELKASLWWLFSRRAAGVGQYLFLFGAPLASLPSENVGGSLWTLRRLVGPDIPPSFPSPPPPPLFSNVFMHPLKRESSVRTLSRLSSVDVHTAVHIIN